MHLCIHYHKKKQNSQLPVCTTLTYRIFNNSFVVCDHGLQLRVLLFYFYQHGSTIFRHGACCILFLLLRDETLDWAFKPLQPHIICLKLQELVKQTFCTFTFIKLWIQVYKFHSQWGQTQGSEFFSHFYYLNIMKFNPWEIWGSHSSGYESIAFCDVMPCNMGILPWLWRQHVPPSCW